MRFERQQAFSGSVDDVVAILRDPGFYPRLAELEHLGDAELLAERQTGTVIHLSVRYRLDIELPHAARRWVSEDRLSMVEHSELDLTAGTGTFRILPDHYSELLTCSGTYHFADLPPGPLRTMAGRLSVRVPFVGAKVERVVMDGLEVALSGIVATVDSTLAG